MYVQYKGYCVSCVCYSQGVGEGREQEGSPTMQSHGLIEEVCKYKHHACVILSLVVGSVL